MNVSRNVVREALSRLRMLGMVETRKRRGMILTEPDVLSGLERILDPKLLSRDIMKQLFELRLVLEVGISDLLFIRKTEVDLQKLEKIVKEEAKVKTQEGRIELDVKFHSTLYQTTGNETSVVSRKCSFPCSSTLSKSKLDRWVYRRGFGFPRRTDRGSPGRDACAIPRGHEEAPGAPFFIYLITQLFIRLLYLVK